MTPPDPTRIDSAGVIVDQTLMAFDYLSGAQVESLDSAPAPLGPTGGAALYCREAFEAVGGFDELQLADGHSLFQGLASSAAQLTVLGIARMPIRKLRCPTILNSAPQAVSRERRVSKKQRTNGLLRRRRRTPAFGPAEHHKR